jgi:hypothetical protein
MGEVDCIDSTLAIYSSDALPFGSKMKVSSHQPSRAGTVKRIDSPLDAALTVYEGDPQDSVFETILKIAGQLFLPVGMITALRDHFSAVTRQERILELLRVFKSEVEALQNESAQDHARGEAVKKKLASPKFTEAVLTAAEEAQKTADSRKIDRLACALANCADPESKISDDDDLASFIRDVSQLSELDIQALKIIYATYEDDIAAYPNLNDPNVFTSRARQLLANADMAGMHRDDFYAHSFRLVGFGLGLEAPRNPGRQAPGDYCIRPTLRGLKLIALLKKRTC